MEKNAKNAKRLLLIKFLDLESESRGVGMGAYSGLDAHNFSFKVIQGWALNRINTVYLP